MASVMLFAVSLPAKSACNTDRIVLFSAIYSLSWGSWHGIVAAETFTRGVARATAAGRHCRRFAGFTAYRRAAFRRAVLAVLAIALKPVSSACLAALDYSTSPGGDRQNLNVPWRWRPDRHRRRGREPRMNTATCRRAARDLRQTSGPRPGLTKRVDISTVTTLCEVGDGEVV